MVEYPGEAERLPQAALDPDPFTVATAYMAGAALVLQLVQTVQGLVQPRSNSARSNNAQQILLSLEGTAGDLITRLDRLNRTIERGSSDSDLEFYGAPLRVAARSLLLQIPSHVAYQQGLGETYGALGTLSQWINHVIREDPALAGRLGTRMSASLRDTAALLNTAMAEGRPTREVIREGRRALEELARAIEAEIAAPN